MVFLKTDVGAMTATHLMTFIKNKLINSPKEIVSKVPLTLYYHNNLLLIILNY